MELKLIRTKKDYRAALAEVDRLWDAPAKSTAADRLDVLTLLIEQYEREHYPVPDPDPIDFLGHVMEARSLTRKDLEPYIGPRGRVSDILNRTRPLTLEMIRKLADGVIQARYYAGYDRARSTAVMSILRAAGGLRVKMLHSDRPQ